MYRKQNERLQSILQDLRTRRRKKVIVDTDAFNEMDDQFAIAYALGSEAMDVLAINAAPFHNDRSAGFEDGMVKSYEEIKRITACQDNGDRIPVFMGSRRPITVTGEPDDSPAARNIIDIALRSDETIYILTLGACTNVTSAIMMCPEIAEKICVVWLAAAVPGKERILEFNLAQDYRAGQILFNSTVPLVLCPAWDVTCTLSAGAGELLSVEKSNRTGAYIGALTRSFWESTGGGKSDWKRIIWDIAAPALIAEPDAAELSVFPAPVLTDDQKYACDSSRHHMIFLTGIDRDRAFASCFAAIAGIHDGN